MATEPSNAGSNPAPVVVAGDAEQVTPSRPDQPQATPSLQEAVSRLPTAQAVKVERAIDQIREASVVQPQALAVRQPTEFNTQLEPQSYSEAKLVAADLFAARLFNGYGNAAAVLSTILIGRELGLQVGASLRGFHVVDGKHVMAADLIRARVLTYHLCEYFRCTERTPEQATFVTKRKGDPEVSLTFTIAEARQAFAGSDEAFRKSGNGKNPADMCVARASSKLARLVYPERAHGFYAPEEMD